MHGLLFSSSAQSLSLHVRKNFLPICALSAASWGFSAAAFAAPEDFPVAAEMAVTQSGRNEMLPLERADSRSLEKLTPDGRTYYQAGSIENMVPVETDDDDGNGGDSGQSNSDAPALVIDVSNLARSPFYRTIGTLNSSCMGTLVAPRVVLTTGSCVYNNGQWLWSTMKFIPGLLPDGTQPYSYALAIGAVTYVGWMQGLGYDDDMGFVILDRPIGAITGALPYSADYSESDYQDWPFMHFGYSGKSLYQIHALLSEDLFDQNIDDYQVDTYMTVPYQLVGTKGAGLSFLNCVEDAEVEGAIYCEPRPNILNGVLSRFGLEGQQWPNEEMCDHTWCGYDTRLTDTKAADLTNYIKTTVPGSPDYMPLYVHIGGGTDFASTSSNSATLLIGSTYDLCYLLHNNSISDASNIATSIDFRLSLNSVISTGDRQLISPLSSNVSLPALNTGRYCEGIQIPTGTAPGTYYIGLLSSFAGDYDKTNNITTSRDVLKITAQAP